MTRDESKALLGSTALLMFEHNRSFTLDGDKTLDIINKIFDEYEEHLMDRDDEIELLKHRIEELIKPKTCEGCKHKPNDGECYYEPCGTCARFFYDHYELKGNA